MSRFATLAGAAIVALMAVVSTAHAALLEEVQLMIKQGEHARALKRLDGHLSGNPQDAEARFVRGLVLVKLGRSSDAVSAFSELTRDYPQLPEPYNNLAVLYAQQGEYEKARDALEAALATHPSYSTAHENLGDIYTALAGAAYNRALLLDKANESLRVKLNLMNQLNTMGDNAITAARDGNPIDFSRPTAAQRAEIEPFTPPIPVAEAPKPIVKPAPPRPVRPAPVVAPAPEPIPPADRAASITAVTQAVFSWANAWSDQNINRYLDSYDAQFQPPAGMSRSAWENQRKQRVAKPKKIAVDVINPSIELIGNDRARAVFNQRYSSDSFTDEVRKELLLRRSNNRWRITREAVVN